MEPDRGIARAAAGAIGGVALFALVLQYALLLDSPAAPDAGMATLRFFGYFTILSNCAVAAVCLAAASARGPAWLRALPTRAAVALYIAVTGLVYAVVLAGLWQPQGAQWWADVLLHTAVPLLYLAWWALANPHGGLRLRHVRAWLVFPLAYLAVALARQRWLEPWSPYPFIDLARHGLAGTLRNAAAVAGVFVVLLLLLLAIDRGLGRIQRTG